MCRFPQSWYPWLILEVRRCHRDSPITLSRPGTSDSKRCIYILIMATLMQLTLSRKLYSITTSRPSPASSPSTTTNCAMILSTHPHGDSAQHAGSPMGPRLCLFRSDAQRLGDQTVPAETNSRSSCSPHHIRLPENQASGCLRGPETPQEVTVTLSRIRLATYSDRHYLGRRIQPAMASTNKSHCGQGYWPSSWPQMPRLELPTLRLFPNLD